MSADAGDAGVEAPARVFLHPIALPLSLGYIGLLIAGGLPGTFQFGPLPVSEQHTVGPLPVSLVPGLQLIACVMAFLGRNTPVATEMGSSPWRGWPRASPCCTSGVASILAGIVLASPLPATALTTCMSIQ